MKTVNVEKLKQEFEGKIKNKTEIHNIIIDLDVLEKQINKHFHPREKEIHLNWTTELRKINLEGLKQELGIKIKSETVKSDIIAKIDMLSKQIITAFYPKEKRIYLQWRLTPQTKPVETEKPEKQARRIKPIRVRKTEKRKN
jgi:hypothetical protein